MTIHELLALNGLTESDEIPVWDAEASSEPTKKITAQNFASSIKTLASLLGTGDVVNDLTSTATNKPLSAAQGKALADGKVAKSGDTMTGNLSIKKTTPAVAFYDADQSYDMGSIYAVVSSGQNRFAISQRAVGSSAKEAYFLPVPSSTNNVAVYTFVTSKQMDVNIDGSIEGTSQSAFETALTNKCSALAYGQIYVTEVYCNWSGSFTGGGKSLAILYRLNQSGNYYHCYLLYGGAQGYYYSNAWHWQKPTLTSI